MTEPGSGAPTSAGFDAHAERYRQELAQGLMLSGESSDYFLRGRLARTRALLRQAAVEPAAIIDFGCGVGTAAEVLRELFPSAQLSGTDISEASLDAARRQHGQLCDFRPPTAMQPASADLVYCNGVFHHIPPLQRTAAMAQIGAALKPGAHLAFWDNNPWSLAARWVMSRIPFDHDAVMVWPRQARTLIAAAGLQVLRTEFHFIWPRAMRWLRFSERWVRALPLAAQYLVWARKPH